MDEQSVMEILNHVGAVIKDSHIVYTSWKHGSAYVDKDYVSMNPVALSMLAAAIACDVRKYEIQAVVAPAVGAIALGNWVAYHLSSMSGVSVKSLIADKKGDQFVIRPGDPALISNANVLVVEDILTTGGSAKKVVELVRSVGGNVVSVAVLCNRGGVTSTELADAPIFALANVKMDAWGETDCPLCRAGVPVNTRVGKGREYLARKSFVV